MQFPMVASAHLANAPIYPCYSNNSAHRNRITPWPAVLMEN
jgi:hypothetical protein